MGSGAYGCCTNQSYLVYLILRVGKGNEGLNTDLLLLHDVVEDAGYGRDHDDQGQPEVAAVAFVL